MFMPTMKFVWTFLPMIVTVKGGFGGFSGHGNHGHGSSRCRRRSPFHISLLSPQPTTTTTMTKPMGRPSSSSCLLQSSATPFDTDLYNDDYEDDEDNPFMVSSSSSSYSSSLAVDDPDTKLVIGLNKYSHDTALCAADARTGQVLFCLEKERLTRRKHEGGNVATLVDTCLEVLDLELDNIDTVIVNNHHHRVLPLEESLSQMEWECGCNINGGMESGYDEDENRLSQVRRHHELSHHLAHAYSSATQSPFDRGMVVVMDGMGETYRTMWNAHVTQDSTYTSDWTLAAAADKEEFQCIPSDLPTQSQISRFDWREAESVYTFTKQGTQMKIKPVFKRFTEEKTPPTLYNHGFENMDSVGALYSRASTHIFNDWNACGKVMGLAPWAVHSWTPSPLEPKTDDNDNDRRTTQKIVPKILEDPILWGSLYSETPDTQFQVDRTHLRGTPFATRNDPDMFDEEGNLVRPKKYDFDDDEYQSKPLIVKEGQEQSEQDSQKLLPTQVALDAITLASRIQTDTETVLMDLVQHFKDETGETNLCIAGGVAQNSVLNGRLCRELGFDRTYISPYPGDEGIAVGCCAFGLYGLEMDTKDNNNNNKEEEEAKARPRVWTKPLPAYLGPDPSEHAMKAAIDAASPWIEVDIVRDDARRFEIMAQEIESGGVIAWYHGRSEVGPRALGHRSILADPRKSALVRYINQHVKFRESFRPFAPSVLAEEAAEWFDLGDVGDDPNISPYMSMTAYVTESKRGQIPSVTHVDGSSRLQTVTKEAEPLYHQLISAFFKRTGVPMVLNTSFNTLPGEPIVETPREAIRSFLSSMGSIEFLVMGDYIIKRKNPDLQKLLGAVSRDGNEVFKEPACPIRSGPADFESSFAVDRGETDDATVSTTTKVRMTDRPMHNERNEWFTLLDELEGELLAILDGTVTMNDVMAHFTSMPEDEEINKEQLDESQVLLQNIVRRLVRLYEYTLISW